MVIVLAAACCATSRVEAGMRTPYWVPMPTARIKPHGCTREGVVDQVAAILRQCRTELIPEPFNDIGMAAAVQVRIRLGIRSQ